MAADLIRWTLSPRPFPKRYIRCGPEGEAITTPINIAERRRMVKRVVRKTFYNWRR